MSADRLRLTRLARAGAVLLIPAMLGACEWFTDFKDQPRIEPWEAEYQGEKIGFRGNPANSVPMYGGGVPDFQVGLGRFPMVFPAVIDSFAAMPNPIPADSASLETGRKYFQINCAICHGPAGAGNGVMLQYGVAAPSLVNERVRGLSDGYIYGVIRNGRGAMPNYARIEHRNRWDVVNYLRALQAGTADTSSVGTPGTTGDALPGATMTAPTRPAPFVAPSGQIEGMTQPASAGTTQSSGGEVQP